MKLCDESELHGIFLFQFGKLQVMQTTVKGLAKSAWQRIWNLKTPAGDTVVGNFQVRYGKQVLKNEKAVLSCAEHQWINWNG